MTASRGSNFEVRREVRLFQLQELCTSAGNACCCIDVAKKHPHSSLHSFDLPPVEPSRKSTLRPPDSATASHGLGDFFTIPLPRHIITMGILHDWNLEKKCISSARLTMRFTRRSLVAIESAD